MSSVEQVRASTSTLSRSDLLRAIGLGVGFDLAFNNEAWGLGVALFAIAAAVTLRSRIRRSFDEDLLLAGAVVLASFTMVRAAEWLVALNLLVALSLVVGAVAPSGRRIFRTTVVDLLRRAGHVIFVGVSAPVALLLPAGRAIGSIGSDRLRSTVRIALIVTPVVAIFTALLASADRVFGELLVPELPSLELTGWAAHTGWFVFGALLATTALLAAYRPMAPDPELATPPRLLRPTEWGTLLASVDALFALFVAVQIRFLFGGQRHVEVTPGLTYAEYARSGFFQLFVVVALTGLLIIGIWDLGELARRRTAFRIGVTILVALSAVVLASALTRMFLYERAFGFTLLRLAATIALLVIGAALVCLVGAIWLNGRAYVVAMLCCCAIAGLLAMNVLNPERFVAQQNVRRFEQTRKLDAGYLLSLRHDAARPIAAGLGQVPLPDRDRLRAHLCELGSTRDGWRSRNAGRASARDVARMLSCPSVVPSTR